MIRMQKVNINSLVNKNNKLKENIPSDIIIIGKINELIIKYKYDQLNLLQVECNEIDYYNQEGESIKNHILPNSLKILNCPYNILTALPDLPNNINKLYCGNNQLMELPELPNSLKVLHCENNKLKSLLNLSNSLELLYCPDNKLTSLSDLPKSLKYLYCYNNLLTSITDLPNSLKGLHCSYNKLTSLPNLPNSLSEINTGIINLDKIEFNPSYKNAKFYMIDSKITIGNYIIKSKEDYISYMEDYEKYLLSKVKSARN